MIMRKSTGTSTMAFLLVIFFGIAAGYSLFGESRDHQSYLSFFQDLGIDRGENLTRFEPGFFLSAWIGKYILGLPYSGYIFIMASAALMIKMWVFNRTTVNPLLTLLFYLANWYPVHEYTQIRAAAATSLLFVALDLLFKRNWARFAIICALAASFHISALYAAAIIVMAYMLSGYSLRMTVLIVIGTSLILPYLLINVLLPYIDAINPLVTRYIILSNEYDTPTLLSGANVLTVLFLVLFPLSTGLKTRRHRTLYIVAVQSLLVFVALANIPVFAHRLREIGLVFITLLAFDYRLTVRNAPQMIAIVLLSVWTLYKILSLGIL